MHPVKLGILSLLLLALVGTAWAQTGTSRIVGTVTDSTGAVVSGAKVTAIDEATNVTHTTVTSPAGNYSFESMVPGSYTIRVQAEGFKALNSKTNVLTIGQPTTVNVRLEVGAASENVNVVASADVVQTSTSGNFGNLEDQAAVTELPIIGDRGRNPLQLVNFQPGVVVGDYSSQGVHVHGSRDGAWNYTLDGVDVNETSAPGGNFTPIRPNPDMLAEFRVLTGNASADTGRASGGDVEMVTRSGTNQFHGNAFFFYQTPGLDANEVGNKMSGLPRNMFLQDIAGFSVGGPIWKKHTFFFFNTQFLRTRRTQKVSRSVLTQDARQGLFRYVVNPTGCVLDVTCPQNLPANASGASVDTSGNVLPGVNVSSYDIATNDPWGRGLDPSIQSLINLTPLPNDFTQGDGLNFATFDWTPSELEKQADYTIRIDHTFNDRHSVFMRWMWGHQNTNGDIGNAGEPAFPGEPNWVNTERTPRNLAVNWRWNPSAHSTNELVFGINRFTFNFLNGNPNYQNNPPYMLNYMLNWDPSGCFPPCNLPLHNDAGNLRTLTTYQVSDNFTYMKSKHAFRWGGQVLYQRHVDNRGSIGIYNADPAVYFNTSTNPVDVTAFNLPGDINQEYDLGNAQAEVNDLLGRVGRIDQGFVAASASQWQPPKSWFNFDSRFPEYDLYFQDSWKIKPHFQIDAGLRWEIRLSPSNPNNMLLRPNEAMVYGATPNAGVTWTPGKLYNNAWKNFGPSIGFAWDVTHDGKTSIRGNYRLAYDRINTFVTSSYIIQNLPGETYSSENVGFGVSGGRLSDGLPPFVPPSATPASLRTPPPFSTNWTTVMDPTMTTPRTHMWGLSLQRELPHKLGLELNYIGRHGSHLFGGYDSNQYQLVSNGFLAAFKQLQANGQTGDSPLIDSLLANYPGLSGLTPSAFIQSNYSYMLTRNSVGELAKFVNLATDASGNNQLIAANGFSPYFFNAFPQYASEVDTLDTHDWSNYNAFEAQLQRRFSNGLQFQFSYTYSKSLDTRSFDPMFNTVTTGGAYQSSSSTPWDYSHRSWNYAPSDFDRRHALQGDWVWEFPLGRGKQFLHDLNPILDRVVGGWSLSGIFTLTSGMPFTVFSGAYTYSDSVQTPANCSGCSPTMGKVHWEGGPAFGANSSQYYFTQDQIAKFSQPDPGSMSNTGRNYFRLPHYFNVDASLAKKFRITESQSLELRFEAENITNSVMYGLPYSSRITSTLFGYMTGRTSNGCRKAQLSAKYTF
jgi:hypothetical protein